jgi:uncharacterized DUF497 family protein
MPWFETIWTRQAEQKLAEHGVTPEEFDEVVLKARQSAVQKSRTSDNRLIKGMTATGRELICVFTVLDELTIVPVTAYEPTELP